MKKRFFAVLLTAALLFQAGAVRAESAPLVYRVTDGDGHVIYLLGTIHVGNKDMYPLGAAVEEAYRETDLLAVELDLYEMGGSILGSLKYAFTLMYGFNDSIKNHISPETYALGVEKLGMPEIALRQMRPALWYSLAENYMISSVGLDAALGVDYHLLERAHKDGKAVEALETMEEQLDALLRIPEAVIDYEIQAMLTYPEESGAGLLALFEAWRQGDLEALTAMLEGQGEEMEAELQADYDTYSDVLIVDRNDGFEKKALEYLQQGQRALIAIGAFHILGEEGLANRLARAGYRVELVSNQ